jgi:DNA polymerase-3 subunit beta
MSSFTLPRKNIQKAINLCNQISPRKSEVDIFTFTKVVVMPESVEFSVANGQIYYKAEIPMDSLGMGENLAFLVKTETLANIVALMTDEKLFFEVNLEKGNLLIKGSRSKHNLRINADVEQFNLPEKEPEHRQVSFTVKAEDLINANRFAFIAVGLPKNIFQPEFLSICYSFVDDQLFVVSTDRYRIIKHKLAHQNTDFAPEIEQPRDFLILPKNLQILNSALEGEDVNITLEKGLAYFESGKQTFTCRYGDGKYPEYNKIIPQTFSCNFTFDVKESLEALRQVYFFAKANTVNKNIKIEVVPENSEIKLSASTDEGNTSESTLKLANYEGQQESWSQSFNADYLLDYISSLSCETVLWESNPGKPSVLSPLGDKENQLYLVSGLR